MRAQSPPKTESDDAYRWIIHGTSIGHSKLSQFRVGHREALEKLLTDVLASLLQQGFLSLDRVAHASAPSFGKCIGVVGPA